MAGYYRAVAVDYDGTLTQADRPAPEVLDAVAEARRAGVKVVLVSGRIGWELEADFPDVADHFDTMVLENGAVLAREGVARSLATPVDAALDAALAERGVAFRRGRVLLACAARDDVAVLEELRRLGLDDQLVHNRDQLMVVPSGVSKGAGVFEALGDLGVSYHNTIAVGDAENDRALLQHCELGVAVANAVESLRTQADLVLRDPDGVGTAQLLRGPILSGKQPAHNGRWQMTLGRDANGVSVRLPASQLNLLVLGGSRSGKSYVAGLVAEQLVGLGYSVLVADPEGDHVGLASQRRVLGLGAEEGLPRPAELAALLGHRFTSIVVDLSLLGEHQTNEYLLTMAEPIERLRAATGLPQWVIIDEAHEPLGHGGALRRWFSSGQRGCCVVTYRPADLCPEVLAATDAVILVPGEEDTDAPGLVAVAAAVGCVPAEEVAHLLAEAKTGQAVLIERRHPAAPVLFNVDERMTPHVRHWHKYARSRLAAPVRFYFRRDWDTPSGAVAANLVEFHDEITRCEPEVIRHHLVGGDFSRWLRSVIRDEDLAHAVRLVEGHPSPGSRLEESRQEIVSAIQARYFG